MYKSVLLLSLLALTVYGQPGPDQHWCCKTGAPRAAPLFVSKRVVHYDMGTVALKVGYHECGTWGTQRCSQYHTAYKSVAKYGVAYQKAHNFEKCKPENYVCCDGHMSIANHCISHADFLKNADNIIYLEKLNLIDKTGVKKVGKK